MVNNLVRTKKAKLIVFGLFVCLLLIRIREIQNWMCRLSQLLPHFPQCSASSVVSSVSCRGTELRRALGEDWFSDAQWTKGSGRKLGLHLEHPPVGSRCNRYVVRWSARLWLWKPRIHFGYRAFYAVGVGRIWGVWYGNDGHSRW